MDEPDPTVSAVVDVRSPSELPESASDPDAHQRAVSKLKAHLTSAGFEVHAPFHTSFSIGAKQSHFEKYFDTKIAVEEGLITSVTLEGGGTDLSLDPIPEEDAGIVKRIYFMPPPDFVPR
jgi:hypothetical protein